MAVTEHGRARCRSCGTGFAHEIVRPSVAPCETGFVRTHYHLGGVCQKWAGLGVTFQDGRISGELSCPSCGSEALSTYVVTGRVSDKARCGDICQSATGPSCDCQCGGANHGIGGAA